MAKITIDNTKNRWLIVPADIMERSALLQLPSRKWMMQMGMVIATQTPTNARALKDQIDAGRVVFDHGDVAELYAQIEKMLSPARNSRTFPTWYKFNNNKFPPAEHQQDALIRTYPVDSMALLMEMGTMKTRVMIDWCTANFYERNIQFVIVITPLTVKMSTWQDELENFSPCPYNFIDVDTDYRASSFRVTQDRLTWLVVGIESLSQGKTFAALEPVTRLGIPYACGVDESTRISNYKAICTQAAFKLRKNAARRFIATGFEIKRNIEDLYSQFEFLDPNIIGCGDYLSFRNRYCMMGGYKNKQIIGYNHIDELTGLIAPYVYQADKSILKLPPKLYEKRIVQMSPEQKKIYQKIKRGEVEHVSVENVLVKTIRLHQIACGFYNTDRWRKDPETGKKYEVPIEFNEVVPPSKNPKLRELLNVADEINHPMIIWAETDYETTIIEAALSKRGKVLKITGATPKEERRGIVQEFQTGKVPYFVGRPAAGGIGITLTAARTVVYFSNSERLENRVQSEDRAHRKGQTGSVTVVDLVMAGSVDVGILANHAEKIELATFVKGALRDRIALEAFYDGELTIDQIRDIAARAEMRRSNVSDDEKQAMEGS